MSAQDPESPTPEGADAPVRIVLDRDVPIPLRDGVVTRANVWRPLDGGPVPAILIRTPYGKDGSEISAACDPRLAAGHGFAVVCQDVRGRGRSEGVFAPYLQEGADGYDSIEHVAALPWCSGDVVMTGNSYVGATQWLAALEAPPSLRAIAPGLTADRYDEGWTHRGGVMEIGFIHTWIVGSFLPPVAAWLDGTDALLGDPAALVAAAPWSAPWFDEPAGSAWWERLSIATHRARVQVPAFSTGGWYDVFLAGTLRNFAADDRSASRLVVGPWGHDSTLGHLVGERNLGYDGSGEAFGIHERQLEFYRAAIAGAEPPGPAVSAYVLGARRWLSLPGWPPPGARTVTAALGTGSVVHDPEDLPPTLGGRALRVGTPASGFGPFDQSSLAAHPGVADLALEPFAERTLLAGPVSVDLRVRAEGAPRADWVCTLCLEDEAGTPYNLAEGLVRADAAAGAVVVELGDVCVEVAAGARLRLLVAGASHPRWEPLPEPRRQEILAGSTIAFTVADA